MRDRLAAIIGVAAYASVMGSTTSRVKELRWAAVLLLMQGVLMEGAAALGLIVVLAVGTEQSFIADHATVFALPYLQENLYLMMGMSGIFGALRIIGAVALWRNRLWGAGLSISMCLVTLVLMIFLLPAGLADGLLSGTALVLILHSWLGRDESGAVRAIID